MATSKAQARAFKKFRAKFTDDEWVAYQHECYLKQKEKTKGPGYVEKIRPYIKRMTPQELKEYRDRKCKKFRDKFTDVEWKEYQHLRYISSSKYKNSRKGRMI